MGVCLYREVGPGSRRLQVPGGAGTASALPGGQLIRPGAFLAFTVEIGVLGIARLYTGINKGASQCIWTADIGHTLGTVFTMKGISPSFVSFGTDEVRQHILP